MADIPHSTYITESFHYDYARQENQGFPEGYNNSNTHFQIRKPKEISHKNIKNLLNNINHKHWDNDSFINSSVQFLKFLYVKHVTLYSLNLEGYIPLMANIIAKYLGNNVTRSPLYYKDILDALESIGVLSIDHHFKPQRGAVKGKAKGYKLNIANLTDTEFDSLDKKYQKEWRVDDECYKTDLQELTIDLKKYTLIANLIFKPKRDQGMRILDFWGHGLHFVVIDQNNRIHSMLSQTPKQYRNCFNINGEPIFEVDVHACQPCLFLNIVVDELNHKKSHKKSLAEYTNDYNDLADYVANIQSGTFYTNLYKIYKKHKTSDVDGANLSKFKKDLLAKVFFAKLPVKERGIIRIFSETYPTIYNTLKKLKTKDGYASIANRLQMIESEIMDTAITLLKNDSSEWYLRFHDAILCREQNCAAAITIVDQVIKNKMGIGFKLKSGLWGKPFNEVLDEFWLPYHQVGLDIAFNEYRRGVVNKNRRKIFSGDEDKSIKYNKYKSYTEYLESDPEYHSHIKELEAVYRSTALVYPFNWTEDIISSFKNYALSTVLSYLRKEIPTNLAYNKKLLDCNVEYWSQIFA